MKSPVPLLAFGISIFSRSQAAPVAPVSSADNGVRYLFVFGNSYSTTGFNPTLEEPNPANPLGNPAYPGETSANGPNWVDFLTTTHNKTYIQTYNFADGGATLDPDVIPPSSGSIRTVTQQINSLFIPKYGGKPATAPWAGENSVFAFFIGINDINNSATYKTNQLFTNLFGSYSRLVKAVYRTGARTFLFINVPPIDRSPSTLAKGSKAQEAQKTSVEDFNIRLGKMLEGLRTSYEGTRVFHYDIHELYSNVLDNPASYPETSVYKNTEGYCEEYAAYVHRAIRQPKFNAYEGIPANLDLTLFRGTPDWYTSIPACGAPVNQYFWLDHFHPTFPVHNVTAREIVALLSP